MICRKPKEACKNPLPTAESRTGKPAMVTLKIHPDCSTVHDTLLWANIYVRTEILTKAFSTSDSNLVALAWTGDESSRGQAQNGVNFDFEGKFDLEGQGQSPPKTIRILTKVFYTYGPNFVILD